MQRQYFHIFIIMSDFCFWNALKVLFFRPSVLYTMADCEDFEDIPYNEYESLSQSQSQPIGSAFDPGDTSASSSNFSDSQVNICSYF